MSTETTLEAAQAHLEFWKQECEAAYAAHDPVRIARCEKFIAQCELIITALQATQSARPAYIPRRRATQRPRGGNA